MNTATSVRSGSLSEPARSKVRDTPGSAAPVMAGVDQQALDRQDEGHHGDLVLGGVERRAGVLGRPGAVEVPAHDLLAVLVQHHDRAGRAADPAVERLLHPVPEADVAGDAPLERQRARELLEPHELAHGDVLAAGAVLDHRHLHVQPARLGERPAHRDTVVADVGHDDQEVVGGIRVFPRHRWHFPLPFGAVQTSWGSRVFCWIRKITNSAGKTGATPTTQTSRPLAMSSSVMVERSQVTKNASSAVVPASAPPRHTVVRKFDTVCRTSAHSDSSFGSNTTHCVPSSIDSSTNRNGRRTLTYFHCVSDDSVRAPQTRWPRPGKNRNALIPLGFNRSWCRLVTSWAMPSVSRMPRITAFAGASTNWLVEGSLTTSHG